MEVIGELRDRRLIKGDVVGPTYISARSLSVDEERFEVLDNHIRQFDYRSFDD